MLVLVVGDDDVDGIDDDDCADADDDDDATAAIDDDDTDQNGTIDFSEFLLAMEKKEERNAIVILIEAELEKPFWTSLHRAAANGHTSTARLLIRHFAFRGEATVTV